MSFGKIYLPYISPMSPLYLAKQASFAKMLGVPVTHLTYEQLQRDSEGVVSGRG